ncbi:MAG: DUF3124 domain-containing protein [Phaeodactylibacter sp.]|uniref:DUF3124 domain-containing protein n=1 Tax=Phaeodactylibacter sp. TaxID=1940289 RepID=UPI0032EFF9A3
MKNGSILAFVLILASCTPREEISSIDPVNWENRKIEIPNPDSLASGTTYLSVYSQIYSQTEHRTHDLTATISLRNVNRKDTVYIKEAVYYDTHGTPIRNYLARPIFIAPMETVEIVIDEIDREGGTGANFLFDWRTSFESNPPLFEAVMISTSGQQGLSFTTQGVGLESVY